ncbi:MFS transporter [Ammoniphilus sp. 3BR4]|uniref:MFS transporter n=1 Tax=Ammoniphilus sp. 3BR4 TaxID=3158265 RepID=UPI003467A1A6
MKNYLQLAVIYLSSFTSWFFVVPMIVYGYITNSFPGQSSLTVLMMTLPSLFAMIGGFAAIPLTRIMSKKSIVIVALCLNLIGGLIILFMGTSSLTIALIGAAITGIPAGLLPSVNNVVLPIIAPKKLREKVIGFDYAMLTLGMVIVTALSGFLASDGDWVKAYNVFYIIIPIIIITIFFYPKIDENSTQEIALTTNKERTNPSLISVLSKIPKFVFSLLIVRFIAGFFIMGLPLNISDYFINERHISSSMVGLGASAANLVAMFGTAFLFIWMKKFRGFSLMMALAFSAIAGLACLILPDVYANFAGFIFAGVGAMIFASAVNTLLVLGFKGKMAETISSLCIVAMFAGEFLAGYVPPLLSELIFGGVTASANIQVASVGCIIIGIASVPFCKIAYKHLFASEKKEESYADEKLSM